MPLRARCRRLPPTPGEGSGKPDSRRHHGRSFRHGSSATYHAMRQSGIGIAHDVANGGGLCQGGLKLCSLQRSRLVRYSSVPSSLVACAPRRSIRLWPTTMAARTAPAPQDAHWLDRFHAGERAVLGECYRDHFRVVESAVGQVLRGADKETVIHDVFLQLLAREELRRGFTGGSFTAWLATTARHQAIDYRRRYRSERGLDELPYGPPGRAGATRGRSSAPPRRACSSNGFAARCSGQVGAGLRARISPAWTSGARPPARCRPDDAGLPRD